MSEPSNTVPCLCLVEDDPTLALGLRDALTFEGWRVVHCDRGLDVPAVVRETQPDCIILDVMLPDINGYQLCETIRRDEPRVPILMLSARSQEADKIRGLNAGADDYVTKPFSVGELVARLQALMRRASLQAPPTNAHTFQIGSARIDPQAQQVWREGQHFELSFYEVRLLQYLYAHRGKAVSREDILEKVWEVSPKSTNRSIDNFIVKLRRKIEAQPDKP
ncbi:MAG: response regulator transcription factor, partial [Polyangiales bacterium]